MAEIPNAEFLATLRAIDLLEPGQMHQVETHFPGQFPTAGALARELVKRGWLTAFQVNQLHRGRGRELALGPYVLLDRLGGGGMGEVFKARHRLIRTRTVALKVIREDRLDDPRQTEQLLGRFQREPEAMARLSHANVVAVHDAGNDAGRLYLVMEYLDGRDLSRVVKEEGPLPITVACDYAWQAAQGLQHLHEHGMVHRDIKPGNLMLTGPAAPADDAVSPLPQPGVVKILDLGMVLWRRPDAQQPTAAELTQNVVVLGTPAYRAPEQALNSHAVDIRADLYSLGRTLYFLLTGQTPAAEQIGEDLPPVSSLRPDVPAGLVAVVRRLTARRPEDRLATPAEAADALAVYCGRPRSTTDSDTAPLRQPGPGWWRRRALVAAGVALLLLIGGVVAVRWAGPRETPVRVPNREAGDERAESAAAVPPAQAPAADDKKPQAKPPAGNDPPPAKPNGPLGVSRKLHQHTQPVLSVTFVPGQDQALSCSHQEMILWDLKTNKILHQTSIFDRPEWNPERLRAGDRPPNLIADGPLMPYGVAACPDGKRAFVGTVQKVLFWDLRDWKKRASFAVPHNSIVGCCVAVSANGKLALFANHENVVRAFDPETETERGYRLSGWRASPSADGRRVLTGTYSQLIRDKALLQLYDGQDGTRLARFGEHLQAVSALALAADGNWGLSAGAQEASILLWDLRNPQKAHEVRRFEGHPAPPFGANAVQALAFSPDGKRALSGGADGIVRLWDVATGKELHQFAEHDKAVTCVTFSSGGDYALSGSEDQAVGVWKLPGK